MTSGIYAILNLVNGKVYVGSSINVHCRLAVHRISLARGKHDNGHLQRAWNKYGTLAFSFDVLKECPENELLEQEQFHIDVLDSMNPRMGYNQREAGPRGSHGPEVCARISASSRGRPHSKEHNAAVSLALQGHAFSVETHKKMSLAQKGNTNALGSIRTPETRAKIGAAHKGKRLRPETLAKLILVRRRPEFRARQRDAQLGRKHTQESRAKMSTARKGTPLSLKHRVALTGRKHSPEHCAAISASLKRRKGSICRSKP